MMLYPEAVVLVGVVRTPRDWAWIQAMGAYRIPARQAPPLVPYVDFLAFYHTAAFGADRWSVRFYAAVRGHELARRRDLLPEEPDHPRAGEPYYLLQLGPLQSLPRPIRSPRGRRFTFLLTTGERLLAASDLSELTLAGGERQVLLRALREAGLVVLPGGTVAPAGRSVPVDLRIVCAQGLLGLRWSDRPSERRLREEAPNLWVIPAGALQENLHGCLRRILEQVGRLGGPASPSPLEDL